MTLAIGLGGSSLIGSVLGMFIKKIPHKWNDIFFALAPFYRICKVHVREGETFTT
jgi:hypothetical protein